MSAKLNLNEMYLSETMPATRSRKIVVPWIEGSIRKRSHRPAFFSIEDARSFYGKQRGFSEGSEQFQASRNQIEYKTSKPSNNNNDTRFHSILTHLEEYLEKCTLHGLKYIGDNKLSYGERFFWLLAFLCAIGFTAYFMSKLYNKWEVNPVIVSFSPVDTGIDTIPFPAVTICNMNQAMKPVAEDILKNGPEIHRRLLDDYCNLNNSFKNDSTEQEATKWDNIFTFILKISQPCSKMLRRCKWGPTIVNCLDYFNTELTDEGLCCTYNMLPKDKIFRNPRRLALLNETYTTLVHDWNPEIGYNSSVPHDALPNRPLGSGAHLGLTVVLDGQLDNYYCSSTNSVGFKVLLASPIETPKMADFSFFLPIGLESRIVIIPEISEASPTLKNIDVTKRKCYFMDERPLQFYRTYTERNCKLECQANHTLKRCGCVPYFLPKNLETDICGRQSEECSNMAKAEMESSINKRIAETCNCLPSCFELNYGKWGSYSVLASKLRVGDEMLGEEYFVTNMAIFHFHFIKANFKKTVKSELYGFYEFLSNTGGLLGLFLGFSFLSAVEIAYYLTLKLCCSFLRSKTKTQTNASVLPFAK